MACVNCDSNLFAQRPRLARFVPPVLLPVVVGGLGLAVWLTTQSLSATSGALCFAVAVVVFLLKTEHGKWHYWGGLKCQQCGYVTLLR